MTSRKLPQTGRNLLEKYVLGGMYLHFPKISNILPFPSASLEQFLRTVWGAVSWVAVLILLQIKLATLMWGIFFKSTLPLNASRYGNNTKMVYPKEKNIVELFDPIHSVQKKKFFFHLNWTLKGPLCTHRCQKESYSQSNSILWEWRQLCYLWRRTYQITTYFHGLTIKFFNGWSCACHFGKHLTLTISLLLRLSGVPWLSVSL